MQIIERDSSASISVIAVVRKAGYRDALRLVAAIRYGSPVRPMVETRRTPNGEEVLIEWRFDWHNTDDRRFANDLIRDVTVNSGNTSRVTGRGRDRLNGIQGRVWQRVENWPDGVLPDVP